MRERRSFFQRVLTALALAALVLGCKASPTSPTATFSTTDLTVGTGTTAVAGKTVTVQYTGWLYDPNGTDHKGTQFDTSIGKAPFIFVLGAGKVIAGWDQGVPGMKIGGSRRLVIPPDLGYGSTASGSIPANSTLVFDIQLLDVL